MRSSRGRLWTWLADGLAAGTLMPSVLRPRLLRLLGVDVREGAEIRHGLRLLGPDLRIGRNVFVNIDVTINNSARVVLGDEVALAPGVVITTTDHRRGDPRRRQGEPVFRPVTIGEGTWLCARALVLPGVTIGEGCIVAAGAVVVRDCAPHGLYAGVPARRVRDLDVEPGADGEPDAGVRDGRR